MGSLQGATRLCVRSLTIAQCKVGACIVDVSRFADLEDSNRGGRRAVSGVYSN